MGITVRKAADRGRVDFGWLDSRHTFSFGHYYDLAHMGFGPLRVINDDRVAGGGGFPPHPHSDMEIISYVLEGGLEHRDSMGNGSVIRYGDVQRMSAGSGVMHSEFNHAPDQVTHFLQIWIEPNVRGIAPGYEQVTVPAADKRGALRLLASPTGGPGVVRIHADASLYAGLFDGGESATLALNASRKAYVHVVRGALDVNGTPLLAGDAALLADEPCIRLEQGQDAEVLVFDLAP